MPRPCPIIGVTGPDNGGGAAWAFTRIAVAMAGGHAVRVTPRRPRRIEALEGLIVGGGADVDPLLYGQEPIPTVARPKPAGQAWGHYLLEGVLFPAEWVARKISGFGTHTGADRKRDALEWRLIDGAVRRGLPVLGICRGEQLLNVYFGGSLYQDLLGFYVEDPETRTILPRKRVLVTPDSKLAKVVGPEPMRVNALHRQGVNRLGAGLRVAARDRNGIVQAIEHASLPFVVGVQWHPEYLPQMAEQRALFKALVSHARCPGTAAPSSVNLRKPMELAPSVPPNGNRQDVSTGAA